MSDHRKRLAAQGLSCTRYHGYDLPEEFTALKEELPEFLFTLLEKIQVITLLVNQRHW